MDINNSVIGSIGSSILRHEDPPLLRGEAQFVADVATPGMLSLSFVRSTVSYGKILDIDTTEAENLSGVLAVITADDLRASLGRVPRIPPRVSFDETVIPYLQPILAVDFVRFVGEAIAMVVAVDRYAAEDGAELVFVDIDLLEPALSTEEGMPAIHDSGNVVTSLEGSYGDVDTAIDNSEVVVNTRLRIGRHSGVPMETRGVAVEYSSANGDMTSYGATKVPHWNRDTICDLLGISPARLTMKETAVGGGFGVRGELYPEDVLAVWAAHHLQTSVKWIEDRSEHLTTANHSRDQVHNATIAGDRNGRITAIKTEFRLDMGAYARTHSVRVADLTLSMLPGPYDIPNYGAVGHCVVTNKTPAGTYRGPGRFESSFVRERLIDLFAAEIGSDPIEVRRMNLIEPQQIPFERPLSSTGESMVFSEGDFPKVLDLARERLDYEDVERRRQNGEFVGAGIAMFLEKSGLGPWETGSIDIDRAGVVSVRSGCSSVGQGIRTVLAQIVADRLEIDPSLIAVELLDTSKTSYGIGSYASRSTVTAGSALLQASDQIIEILRQVAAIELEVAPEDLEFRHGGVEVRGSPEHRMTLFEAAGLLSPNGAAKYGRESPGLRTDATFDVKKVAYPCGAQGAVVRVDKETGSVTVEQLVLCYDIGRAVNPMLVEGQMHGGAIQALGGTLLEDFVYDEAGNPLATSFMDYLLPTLAEMPELTAVGAEISPTATNPLGLKGAGEGGVPGVAAAIASAVCAALSDAHAVTELPIRSETLVTRGRRGHEHSS